MMLDMLKSKKGLEMKIIVTLIILLLFLILIIMFARSLAGESEGLIGQLFDLF